MLFVDLRGFDAVKEGDSDYLSMLAVGFDSRVGVKTFIETAAVENPFDADRVKDPAFSRFKALGVQSSCNLFEEELRIRIPDRKDPLDRRSLFRIQYQLPIELFCSIAHAWTPARIASLSSLRLPAATETELDKLFFVLRERGHNRQHHFLHGIVPAVGFGD